MFFRGLVAATLPLAGAGCQTGGGNCNNDPVAHAAVVDASAGDGFPAPTCESLCISSGGRILVDECAVGTDGGVTTVVCATHAACPGGRRPDGLLAPSLASSPSPVGDWLARLAHLERASITAFRRLRKELDDHGAPRSLVDRASRAMRDEIRHARTVSALARRHGRAPLPVVVRRARKRPLVAIAIENAVEGCVNETWGALVATWQAEAAGDPELGAAWKTIAADETRHAELARAVDAWMVNQLDESDRRAVSSARRRAVRDLARTLDAPAEAALVARVGLPSPAVARALFHASAAVLSGQDMSVVARAYQGRCARVSSRSSSR